MSVKQQIQNIKTNIERTIQGLRTKLQEFTYVETGGFVKPNQLYSAYYTLGKRKRYLTGITQSSNSKFIEKVIETDDFVRYNDIKSSIRQIYPKMTPAKPSESDYRIGEITRYFTQIGNDNTKPIFEISQADFGRKNNLYRYTDFQWRLSGLKEEVMRDNQRTIDGLETTYSGINKILFPLQLWRATKNSVDDVENKLLLMKKT
jgi:hypothetical protein